MSSDLVIDARGLSKCFKLYPRPRNRFFEWVTFGKRKLHDSFWALRDVDVTLKQGEKLGIIGANGSGKSTLLKILAGSLSPTTGSCEITGRAFALIELSTGFNQDLTGRENIAFVGMMLGLDRAYVERRRDRIIDFADIGDFIDRPVRFYSSGMFVRLAFSLFAFLEPDLLMIDEAFAVGDAEFKEKSYRLMRSMVRTQGRSVIFVSHSLQTIEAVCDRVMWIEHGVCRMDGDPRQVIEAYRDQVKEKKRESLEREKAARAAQGETEEEEPPRVMALPRIKIPPQDKQLAVSKRENERRAKVDAVWLEEKDGTPVTSIGAHRKFAIGCAFDLETPGQPIFGVRIVDADDRVVTGADTTEVSPSTPISEARERFAVRWPIARGLPPGQYTVECWCGESADDAGAVAVTLRVEGSPRGLGQYHLVMRPTVGEAANDQ